MGTVKRYSTPGGLLGYEARDSWTDPATGKRLHKKQRFPAAKFGGLKKAEAQANAWLAQREADRSRGVIWEPSRETLGSLIDRWAEQLDAPLAGKTIQTYQSAVKNRYAADVRSWRVGDITPAHVRRLLDRWEREGLSPATVTQARKTLRGALQLARDEGGIQSDPMAGVTQRRTRPQPLVTWSPEQVETFLRFTVGDPFGHAWALMFATCCRFGELCALRWDDISGGVVTIRRTWGGGVDYGERVKIVERTKTGQVRRVPIPADVVAALDQARATSISAWIVPRKDGKPMSPNDARRVWRDAVARSGLPTITPHGARHSGATNMIAAGVPVTTVQRILGHSDPAMTMRRYVHPGDEDAAAAAELLGSLYRGEMSVDRARSAPKVVPITKKLG